MSSAAPPANDTSQVTATDAAPHPERHRGEHVGQVQMLQSLHRITFIFPVSSPFFPSPLLSVCLWLSSHSSYVFYYLGTEKVCFLFCCSSFSSSYHNYHYHFPYTYLIFPPTQRDQKRQEKGKTRPKEKINRLGRGGRGRTERGGESERTGRGEGESRRRGEGEG